MTKYFQNKWLKYLPEPFPSQYPCKNKCPEKGEISVRNSIIICVYQNSNKNKISKPLHADFIVVFGIVYFVTVISNIRGWKMRFSESSQNSISEKSIFGHFEAVLLNLYILPGAGVVISC